MHKLTEPFSSVQKIIIRNLPGLERLLCHWSVNRERQRPRWRWTDWVRVSRPGIGSRWTERRAVCRPPTSEAGEFGVCRRPPPRTLPESPPRSFGDLCCCYSCHTHVTRESVTVQFQSIRGDQVQWCLKFVSIFGWFNFTPSLRPFLIFQFNLTVWNSQAHKNVLFKFKIPFQNSISKVHFKIPFQNFYVQVSVVFCRIQLTFSFRFQLSWDRPSLLKILLLFKSYVHKIEEKKISKRKSLRRGRNRRGNSIGS